MTNLIRTKEAAKILGVTPDALRKWRTRKLFGCPFFPADELRGKIWYYDRERVEQLKAVYQPGTLSNMYKLAKESANIFLVEGRIVTSTVTTGRQNAIVTNRPHHGYFTLEDVAEIFSVTVKVAKSWVERGTLRWDLYDHANRWLFKKETIEAFMERRKRKKINVDTRTDAQTNTILNTTNKQGDVTMNSNEMQTSLNKAVERLKSYHPDVWAAKGIITKAKTGYICPNPQCRNGSGKDGTGATAKAGNKGWQVLCPVCNDGYDIIDTLGFFFNLSPETQFVDIVKRGCQMFGVDLETGDADYKPEEKKIDYERIKRTIANAQKNLADFHAKFGNPYRGIYRTTFEDFGCGYDPRWYARQNAPLTPRLIIPSGWEHYAARLLGKLEDFNIPDGVHLGEKEHSWSPKPIFNFNRLKASDDPICFIVEGELDAMSIAQVTARPAKDNKTAYPINVIAIAGIKLSPLMEEQLKLLPQKNFIVMLDNDEAGNKAAPILVAKLKSLGHKAYQARLSDTHNDANDYLQADHKGLNQHIKEIYATAKEFFANYPDEPIPAVGNKFSAETTAQIDDNEDKELNAALDWLKSLDAEKFTAADARNLEHIRYVALAQVNGFDAEAENFFLTIKEAKEKAHHRLKDAESGLTAALSLEEKNALTALAEGVFINSVRRSLDRAITAVEKEIEAKRAREAKEREQEERRRKRQIAIAIEAEERAENRRTLEALRNQYRDKPTKELADQIRTAILELVDWKEDRGGNKIAVKPTAANANLIFGYDPVLDGLFGYDQFRQCDVFLKAPLWRYEVGTSIEKQPCIGAEWNDRDDAQLRTYVREIYTEFANEKLIRDFITTYSDSRAFHEVKDYFKSLPVWDGTPRAETVFIKFLRADDNDYVREVTMNWLLAAVARIFYPGCDYQTALVLHGNQGIGKSYILSQLGGKWYAQLVDAVDDTHIIDAIRCVWLGEFKEMAGLSKADVRHIKAFLDSSFDLRRFAYERRAIKVLRHCVFAISTNDETFLSDTTGNRRFNIIHCHSKQGDYVEGLTDDYIQQLWAEVYQKFNELFQGITDLKLVGKKLEISRASKQIAAEIAEQHLNDDGMQGEIEAFLYTKIPPRIIWNLLSKEERRKFFVDGGKFTIEIADIEARFKNAAGNRYDKLKPAFDAACTVKDGFVRQIMTSKGENNFYYYVFYGSELRQHICAAEVFTECFGNDKRKRMTRIHEILASLDGWTQGARIQKADPAYGDQKKVFYREG